MIRLPCNVLILSPRHICWDSNMSTQVSAKELEYYDRKKNLPRNLTRKMNMITEVPCETT
jgi:hypothetical protein